METSRKSLSFGFGIVNAGQRKSEYEPEVVALSTKGGFRLTPQVSTALGVQHGDYVMFINNSKELNRAIAAEMQELKDFVTAAGLEWGTPEAVAAIHKEFDMWGVAKGIILKDKNGIVLTVSERITKDDKVAYVKQNFDELLSKALESDVQELKDALTRDGITTEEQIELLSTLVKGKETPKYTGSKCANTSALLGIGVVLSFTDSNVWATLKEDMSDEDKGIYARKFAVDCSKVQTIEIFNGFENVTVPFVILGSYTDEKVARVSEKKAE